MKKIFSAFLLMTMMVFSVGSFVSCSDLENELAQVEGTANDNAAAIESLNSELAALKTALSAAQADADAAMAAAKAAKEAGDAAKAEAEAAKAAAEQAKAEAIAAVMAELEDIQTAIAQNVEAITNLHGTAGAHEVEIEALQNEVKKLQDEAANHVYAITNLNGSVEAHEMAIEDLKTELSVLEATLENYEKNLKELNLFYEQYKTDIQGINYALTNLATAAEKNSADIEGLIEQFEDVVAKVKAVNEALVAVGNVLSALTNQIQSIVYVPETLDGLATAKGYTFGSGNSTKYTDLLVKMTYEVSPKGLASVITSENAAFSTVPVTKAAEAEYFKAQVLSADPATGRVVVYAHIPKNDKSAAYKALTDEDADDETTVALALNVASARMISLLLGDEPEILDAGTYVQSAYTGVLANENAPYQSVYDLITWYNKTKNNTTVVADDLQQSVPWNLAASSTREMFSNYEVRFNVDGTYMTVAEATEFFGQEVKVSYDVKHVDKNGSTTITATPASENNPFTVTGKDLSATVQFANVKNVKDGALVGYNTDVTAYVYVNGQTASTTGATAALTMATNYKIIDKQADIVLADVEKAWAYTEGDNAEVPTQEVDVLEAAGNSDFAAFLTGATWKKNPTATWKYEDENGDEKTATATAVVTAKSKKAVTVEFNNGAAGNNAAATEKAMTYAQAAPATYTFTGIVNKDKVDYTVTFNVKLAGMPADKTIDLNNGQPFQLNASLKAPMVMEDLTPATQTIAHIQAVDENFSDLKDVVTHSDGTLQKSLFQYKSTAVKVDGQDASSSLVSLFLSKTGTGDDTEEASTLTLDGITKYENTIEVVFTYEVAGVTFKYTATIVTKEPVLSFAPSTAYVTADKKVELDGTVKLPITNGVTGTSTPYTLNAIDLRKYVNVTIPEELANDFELRYTFTENPLATFKADGSLDKWNDNPELSTQSNKVTFTNADLPAFKANNTTTYAFGTNGKPVSVYVNAFDANGAMVPCPIDWNTDLREMKLNIALVSTTKIDTDGDNVAAEDDVFASLDVTLVIPELLTFAADEVVKVKIENGVVTKGNIVGALSIVDKFGNDVYNKYLGEDNDLSQLWKGYTGKINAFKELTDMTLVDADFFNVYEMSVAVDESKIKAFIGSTDVTSEIDFDFINANEAIADNKYGTIILTEESATIQGDVEFQVPVVLTYKYDEYGVEAQTVTAKVVFTKNDIEEEDSVKPSFDVPEGTVWTYYDSSIEMDIIVDLGATKNGACYYAMDFGGMYVYATEYACEFVPNSSNSGVIKLTYFTSLGEHQIEETRYIEYSDWTDNSITLYSPNQFDYGSTDMMGIGINYVDSNWKTHPVTATLVEEPVELIDMAEMGGVSPMNN